MNILNKLSALSGCRLTHSRYSSNALDKLNTFNCDNGNRSDFNSRKVFKRSLFSTAKPNWDKAVTEAEKIVGYPPSFANLRWLLSDEIANVAIHLRKLVGTDHPILKTAKNFLYNDKNNAQAWGLVVLLLSKAVGYVNPQGMKTDNGEIFHKQRKMAEIVEMIRTGNLLHKSLLNFVNEKYSNDKETLNFGNKVALLTGDYLLVTANGMLSSMRNQHLSELISSALRDLTECEFIGIRDNQNLPIPSKSVNEPYHIHLKEDEKTRHIIGYDREFEPVDSSDCLGNPVREWTLRNVLGGGSLLGAGCEGAVHLSGHSKEMQESGFLFGCHLSLAWQAAFDYNTFTQNKDSSYSLVSAPVLFAINDDNQIYENYLQSVTNVNDVRFSDLSNAIRRSSALDKTAFIINENCRAAIENLKDFPSSKALPALKKLAEVLMI